MFIDTADIIVEAGKGGDGAIAWRREKFEPSGGPYGGDGGNGGNVIIVADENIRTLMDFRYKRLYRAEHGENGRTKRQFGKSGENIILKVPVGTLIKDKDTGGVIKDLKTHHEEIIIAKGGRGGRGNAKFATPTRQAPNFSEPGKKGERREITLEIKLLADVGLVGYPNVGKSTILSMLSAAKPKIANYHFTTLTPNLGVVRVDEGKSFLMADIPGLIEGASEGVGLGHAFLRHIERTRVICHVIDGAGSEGRNPIEDYQNILRELEEYNLNISKKPELIVINKCDIPSIENYREEIQEYFKDKKVLFVSAATGDKIKELPYRLWELLEDTIDEYTTYDEEYVPVEEEETRLLIEKRGVDYFVEGWYVDNLLERINFNDRDSLRFFQEQLRKEGIIEELEKLGIKEGEDVVISGETFEYTP